ncbi:S8 family serine peptidase [Kitasatospora sp. NPDC058218]|uniref:S8 family serine peptidase n=1 Tax=Kitasatospora sp. NPDC058218 TaxID=3346385 RepID=UPI0036D80E6B
MTSCRGDPRAGGPVRAPGPPELPTPLELPGPLELVALGALMARTAGRPELVVGLVDGPVAAGHPDLSGGRVRQLAGPHPAGCAVPTSASCRHGTFVAGILAGRRGCAAPAICPGCTLLVRPIFGEADPGARRMPSAAPDELAEAIVAVVDAGATVVNISADLSWPSARDARTLTEALDHATRHAVVVAAAGNRGVVGSSALTRHPGVIPVAACDARGRPLGYSNLGALTARRGLSAPGEGVVSLATGHGQAPVGGTSVAAPLVTGTVALLWSLFPAVGVAEMRWAVSDAALRRRAVVPPVLDAAGAHRRLAAMHR